MWVACSCSSHGRPPCHGPSIRQSYWVLLLPHQLTSLTLLQGKIIVPPNAPPPYQSGKTGSALLTVYACRGP